MGRNKEAESSYRRAMDLTENAIERAFLARRIAGLSIQ
jgi:predicted RNA polymerase sigma factor